MFRKGSRIQISVPGDRGAKSQAFLKFFLQGGIDKRCLGRNGQEFRTKPYIERIKLFKYLYLHLAEQTPKSKVFFCKATFIKDFLILKDPGGSKMLGQNHRRIKIPNLVLLGGMNWNSRAF